MEQPRIVVVGSSNTDMIVKSTRIPSPGETVTGGSFFCVQGGKGANQAVAASRLGAQVHLIAKVGDDSFGRQAIAGFRREGIDVEYVFRTSGTATGVAVILVDDQGENLISVASGANHTFTIEDVVSVADIICSASVLILQLEIPIDSVTTAARIAYEAGVPVILNPAPAPAAPLDPNMLRYVSYLTPNETEASRLSGINVSDEKSARLAADKLMSYGTENVVITLGSKGALACNRDEKTLVPAFQVDARDTTAAGDAFNGALGVAIGYGKPLKQAVIEACAAGALATTKIGAQPSLPMKKEVEKLLAEQCAVHIET